MATDSSGLENSMDRDAWWTEKSIVFHGQRSPWYDKESDASEHTGTHT